MNTLLVPLLIALTLVVGLFRRVPVYDTFVEGAKEGLKAAVRVIPFLVAMLPAIALLQVSGVLGALVNLLSPLLKALGLPEQVLPLMLMRPFSGSASLAMLEATLKATPPDGYIGRTASTLLGSSETVFYTVALYLGAAGVKRSRYIVPAALLAWLAGSIAAAWFCRVF